MCEYVDALNLARERIQHRKNDHICVALSALYILGEIREPIRATLIENIGKALKPHATYGDWLKSTNPDTFCLEDSERLGRLAWIDKLIQEYENVQPKRAP